MKRTNHSLQFALLLLFVTLGTLGTAFAQSTPSQDSYTNTATAPTNYGAAVTLGVVSSSTSIQTTYIKFDLSSVPAGYTSTNVAKATLKLYVNSVAKAGSFNVDFINGSWAEKTITADLAPALGSTIASSVPLAAANANDYVLIDVTSAVGDWLNGSQPNDGIALVANSGLSATFDSKENSAQSHPAELDIVFTGGGTITGVTTASGSGLTGGGTGGTLNLSLPKICSSKQVLQWNGSAWVCASAGTGTINGVTAGTGLTGGGTSGTVTLSLDTSKVPELNTANIFNGPNTMKGKLAVAGNGATTYVGDPGCGSGWAGIGFNGLSACANYSIIGNGIDTILNRPSGGTMRFREGNADEVTILSGGQVGIGTLTPRTWFEVDASTQQSAAAYFNGGDGPSGGGYAVTALGGAGNSGSGGIGVNGWGGNSSSSYGYGGDGVDAAGGNSQSGQGGDGIYATAGYGAQGYGFAGVFGGDVSIVGNLSKGGGSFKIDHPLDPANKYLYHSFVESPDMKDIYDGLVNLDASGEALVELPEWFGALNRDFRYQLTCIGGFAPVYIAEEITNNRFRIAGGRPGLKVSWLVTGIRQDAWANAHRIPVEEDKKERERGYYIHPELYGASDERQIEWARHPEMMKQMKEQRGKSAAARKP